MPGFFGFVPLSSALGGTVPERNGSSVPTDAAAAPTYRIYGPSGTVMQNGTGSLSFQDTGSISTASNASPVVYHSPGHNLSNGTLVTASGVTGNSGANASGVVTVIDGDNFSLAGTTGTGSGTGGTWHVTGLYAFSYTPTSGNGFQQGSTYTVYVTASVGGNTVTESYTFIVV
jgi:hypothetical protein